MFGALILGILIASIVILSTGFLLVAMRLGRHFDQIGDQATQRQPGRRQASPRR